MSASHQGNMSPSASLLIARESVEAMSQVIEPKKKLTRNQQRRLRGKRVRDKQCTMSSGALKTGGDTEDSEIMVIATCNDISLSFPSSLPHLSLGTGRGTDKKII